MMRCLVFAALLICAGCMGAQPRINRDQPFVAIGNGGSLHGGNTTTIFADDTAISEAFGPNVAENEPTVLVLPAGTFAKVLVAAQDQIAGFVPPMPGPACLDYGSDYVTVSQGSNDQDGIGVNCPNDGMRAAQNAVLQVYYDAFKEPSE